MATTIVRSLWTGTRGVLDAGLPDDWDEAFAILAGANSCSPDEPNHEVVRANLPVRETVEFCLDS